MGRSPLILPIAEYCPDLPDYMGMQSANVLNVYPRTPRSYGAVGTPQPLSSSALKKRCQGAYFGLDSSGNVTGFAGDANDLYRYTASTSWTAISKSAGAYSLASTDQWHFALYGTRVIATDFADAPQSFVLGTSTAFADLNANAPKARYAAVVRSYLMLGDINDTVYGYGTQHQRVWWSANGDPTNWPQPGGQLAAQFESGFQDLLGDGGWIQGLVGNLGNADVAVIMEHAIWRGVYAGAPAVFDFFPQEGVRGTPAPGSVAQLGGQFFYLGEDDFYLNDGGQSLPIGANKVAKTFYADVDQQYLGSISATIDPINKLYIVFYPGAGHNGALCNKMLMYNWQLRRWSPAVPLAAGGEYIVRALSFGYTLDQIYTLLGYSLDTMPFNLDSRVWSGGSLLLGIFDNNHSINFFTGAPLAATVDTNEIQPTPGGVTSVRNARPIIDGNGTLPSVAIGTRNRQTDSPSFGSAIAMNALGTCPQRAVGRYLRARLTVPSSSSWTNITGVELEGAPAGVRY